VDIGRRVIGAPVSAGAAQRASLATWLAGSARLAARCSAQLTLTQSSLFSESKQLFQFPTIKINVCLQLNSEIKMIQQNVFNQAHLDRALHS